MHSLSTLRSSKWWCGTVQRDVTALSSAVDTLEDQQRVTSVANMGHMIRFLDQSSRTGNSVFFYGDAHSSLRWYGFRLILLVYALIPWQKRRNGSCHSHVNHKCGWYTILIMIFRLSLMLPWTLLANSRHCCLIIWHRSCSTYFT